MTTTNKGKIIHRSNSLRLSLSRVISPIHRSRKAKEKVSGTTWTKSGSYCRRETHTVDSCRLFCSLALGYAGRHSILSIKCIPSN
ncbi:uncharacterized protein P174DRAFT_371835 [Aspergillus novofumigatus IBT 16806]|uniref:Uncharacterized protein n=1 Tax=Aspergillus novofumigatus (strain IBT 16806) TaxID=1392255 RepID=A0A2I1C453_ASPN1|nr:uncharacterized protein P174DRAFT_371835 [Aspergillus novofumigatus IBT 16806]PKX92383.1 hypothetical protein P174DRAFT_371835 [Aspergillus novofumigatus IBT 16806]